MTELSRRRLLQGGAMLAAAFGTERGAWAQSDDQRWQLTLDLLAEAMQSQILSGYIPGAAWAVQWRGRRHVESAGAMAFDGPPMPSDSIFRIASLSKLIAAAAAMMLVEEGRIALDEPVDRVLPELADRRVLKRIDGPLDDTVPAKRPITLDDLLTLRFGLGAIMVWPPSYPIQLAMAERELAPSAEIFSGSSDAFMQRLGELPLAAQPGEAFLYHTGLDVAGVLIERVTGQRLGAFLEERLFGPLGMQDTGFVVPPEKIPRLVTAYRADPSAKELKVFDVAAGGRFSKPPGFEAGGAGLVSTAGDYLAFAAMLLNRGEAGGRRYLTPESVALMTSDHIAPEQKQTPSAAFFFQTTEAGWGYGMATGKDGSFGWIGGYGTWSFVFPQDELIGVLMTQRVLDSPALPSTMSDFAAVLDDLTA